MYTIENKFAEMVQVAKEKGINTKGMNKATLINELNALEPVVEETTTKKGRKINPNSPRQLRLAEQAARKAAGEKVGRGRPANPESAWFKRQAELAAKKEAGELKLGRAINPNSARQQRLALKGTLPLGRPKSIKTEVTEIATTETVAS
jgi:hypothetical protein